MKPFNPKEPKAWDKTIDVDKTRFVKMMQERCPNTLKCDIQAGVDAIKGFLAQSYLNQCSVVISRFGTMKIYMRRPNKYQHRSAYKHKYGTVSPPGWFVSMKTSPQLIKRINKALGIEIKGG